MSKKSTLQTAMATLAHTTVILRKFKVGLDRSELEMSTNHSRRASSYSNRETEIWSGSMYTRFCKGKQSSQVA